MSTEQTELIKRLRTTPPNVLKERKAADALEAMQAENARLTAERDAAKELAAHWERGHKDQYKFHTAEREALQARLTALEGQEPVAWANPSMRVAFTQFDLDGFDDETRVKYSVPLYRAAGAAPAPEEITCEDCGDVIVPSNPGVCGTCFAVKYKHATSPQPPASEPARELSDAETEQIIRTAIEKNMQNFPANVKNSCVVIAHEVARAVLSARG